MWPPVAYSDITVEIIFCAWKDRTLVSKLLKNMDNEMLAEKYFKKWRWNCGIIKFDEEYSDIYREFYEVDIRTPEEIDRDDDFYNLN